MRAYANAYVASGFSRTSMSNSDDLIGAIELHSVDQIRAVLDAGLDVRAPIRGKLPIVGRLLKAAGRPVPPLENIPNRYLTASHG